MRLEVNLDGRGPAEKTGILTVERFDILGDPTTRNVDTLCAVLIDGARPVSR